MACPCCGCFVKCPGCEGFICPACGSDLLDSNRAEMLKMWWEAGGEEFTAKLSQVLAGQSA